MNYSFDVDTFIKEIQNEIVIWDAFSRLHRHRAKLNEAWMQVGRKMFAEFDLLSLKKQNEIVGHLRAKWKTLRASYLKYLRRENKKQFGRKFKYPKQMSFLRNTLLRSSLASKKPKLSTKNSRNKYFQSASIIVNDESTPNMVRGQKFSIMNSELRSSTENCKKVKSSGLSECTSDKQLYLSKRCTRSNSKIPKTIVPLTNESISAKESPMQPKYFDENEFNFQEKETSIFPYQTHNVGVPDSVDTGPIRSEEPVCETQFSAHSLLFADFANEDMAFFRSLLSWITHFSADEKLKFRLEIMKMIQSIQNSERNEHYYAMKQCEWQ